jgi:2-polyprenyl-3-methyl-5-hydroxy-6-metoxy-1,4-benzoquinol methylase
MRAELDHGWSLRQARGKEMNIRKSIARGLRSWGGRQQPASGGLKALEEKIRFLVAENIRLNQVIRELIYFNRLKRSDAGAQTKESFDYQWGEIPEGKWMPSNPDFLKGAPGLILRWTHLPPEWFREKRVLDAGCGSGRWTYGLLKLGAWVTAIDQSLNAVEETRSLIQNLHPAELRQEDLIELRLEKNSYDMVWCFGVAHHTENPIQVIKNVIPAIVPGGYLFMMLYAFPQTIDDYETKASYEEWRQKLLPLSNAEKVDILKKHYPPELVHGYFDAYSPLINDLFTWEWIQAFLQKEGFEGIRRVPDQFNHYFVAQKRIPSRQ